MQGFASCNTILISPEDTIIIKDSLSKIHNPRKATIQSAFIPGWGQVYNKQYWKVPVIYVTAAALIYGFTYNQKEYKELRRAYVYAVDTNPHTIPTYKGNIIEENQIDIVARYRNTYKRYRDMTIIGMVALYALNVIDAHVNAHLFQFDIDENLSLNFVPSGKIIYPGTAAGFTINLKYQIK